MAGASQFTGLMAAVFVAAAAALCGMAAAQSPSDDCTNVLISMSPCLDYISGNSTAPSRGCCTQLGTVVGTQPRCLCQVLNGGGANLGLNVNQTQALALPRACNVQTPPPSQCNGAGGSPSGSPGSSTPSAGGGGGSKTSPSGDNNGSSDATRMSVSVLLSLVFFAYSVFA